MKDILNGGVYKVKFKGSTPAEFSGEHPAVVFQTLKEPDIYIVIPLTTYTKERWEKLRKRGFSLRIHSTNSIARIEKYRVLHEREILNRWKEYGSFLKVSPVELIELKGKLDQYTLLTSSKTTDNYQKYYDQYQAVLNHVTEIKNDTISLSNPLTFCTDQTKQIITGPKSALNKLSLKDIEEIVKSVYALNTTEVVNINYKRDESTATQSVFIRF